MNKRFWTNPKKAALAIILGILAWFLFGRTPEQDEPQREVHTGVFVNLAEPKSETTVEFIQQAYVAYNQAYFQDKLPKDTKISLDPQAIGMADTGCDNNLGDMGIDCTMRFDLKYVLAPRTAESTLLHEMCHIKTWAKTQADTRPEGVSREEWDHNKYWRGCMLSLDAAGAFREINIDYISKGSK